MVLSLDFEGAKNITILLDLVWGFGECWMFLTGAWHLDHDLDIVNGLLYTHGPSLAISLDFGGSKNIQVL